ncbi:unnamed protein product [Periconia digitata]|uniref:Uncharacterized protein n=1 Tax=Periconia digitata TaxID=1303443 RepID=A0A9W4USQ4_9PLEO|nr:unnamed protein product [Periconia digitata]
MGRVSPLTSCPLNLACIHLPPSLSLSLSLPLCPQDSLLRRPSTSHDDYPDHHDPSHPLLIKSARYTTTTRRHHHLSSSASPSASPTECISTCTHVPRLIQSHPTPSIPTPYSWTTISPPSDPGARTHFPISTHL